MKIGIIAPIKFLKECCVTRTQYVLPKLLVGEATYRNFYIKRKTLGDTIILDCRIPDWKRTPEDFGIINKALEIISPDIVVAPSHMFNAKLSHDIYKAFSKQVFTNKCKVVKCIEGTSSETLRYKKGILNAIPSHMFRFLEHLPTKALYIEIHLDPEELRGREGILVTSLPVRLGLQGRLLSDYKPSPGSLTFYEEENLYPKIVRRNIEELIEIYREEE